MIWRATILFVDGSERTFPVVEEEARLYLEECFRKRGVACLEIEGGKKHGSTIILNCSHISCIVFEAVEEKVKP